MKHTRLMAWLAAFLIVSTLLGGCASNSADTGIGPPTNQTEGQKRASIHMQLAVGYYQQGQMKVALDEVRQALEAQPDLVDAYSMAALIHMSLGDTKDAEENFSHAMQLAPNDPELSNNYGWFLCQNGRAKESIAYFEAAVKNKSYQSPAKALNNAGVCSLLLKDDKAAEDYFLRAFRYDPGNPSVSANLAKIYYARGDYDRAHFYLDRLVKEETLSPEILLLGIKIERKRGDKAAELSLVTQLEQHYPDSPEYASYQHGAF